MIVCGAGEVGLHIADRLSREGHDVALIDVTAARIAEAEQRLDINTVVGRATSPSVPNKPDSTKPACSSPSRTTTR